MAKASAKAARRTNKPTEAGFGGFRSGIRQKGKVEPTTQAIIDAARVVWSSKRASNLASAAGVCERRAEQVLEGDTVITLPTYAGLLWSEEGREFFMAVMAAAPVKPRWYRALERELKISAAREAKLRYERQLERLEAGDEP